MILYKSEKVYQQLYMVNKNEVFVVNFAAYIVHNYIRECSALVSYSIHILGEDATQAL